MNPIKKWARIYCILIKYSILLFSQHNFSRSLSYALCIEWMFVLMHFVWPRKFPSHPNQSDASLV